MDNDDAFLQAIREAPEDDVPRLQYADWLEEQGDPRGEFIRLQVEMAKTREDDPRQADWKQRVKQLLAKNRKQWIDPLTKRGVEANSLVLRRGFVEEIVIEANAFLQHAAELFKIEPGIRAAAVTGMQNMSDDDRFFCVERLAECPQLKHLTSLNLGEGNIDTTGVRVLAESNNLSHLTTLDLFGNNMHDTGALALAHSPNLSNLTTLILGNNNIQDRGARALARSPHLSRLTSLDVSLNRLSSAGAWALAESAKLPRLVTLDLQQQDPLLDPAEVQAIQQLLADRRGPATGTGTSRGRG